MGDEDTGLAALQHSQHALLRALSGCSLLGSLRGRRVLVAASAGIDSTVLAHVLARYADAWGIEVALGHVHHGLRGAEADADQAFVASLGRELGVAFGSRRIDPAAGRRDGSSRNRRTLQEAARELRHAALREIRDELGCHTVATAHNLDDQAETLLMRLLRGTGPDGLAGIAPRSPDGAVVRPLLRVPRADIERYAHALGIRWREDSSNRSDRYLRNRIRNHWLPALTEEFNPKLLRTLGDLAEAQRRDGEWIEALVAQEVRARFATEGATEGTWLRIDTADWGRLPEALLRRLARRALIRAGAGRHVSRRHLERMVQFLTRGRPGSAIELPGRLSLQRDAAGFRLGPLPDAVDSGPQGAC